MIDLHKTNDKRSLLAGAIRTALLSGLCLGVGAAYAQQRDDREAQDEQQQTDVADLGAVQVTARRRTETLRDVPISVTAISGEQLQDMGAEDITYLNQVVPNATIETSRGTNNTLTAFIRGIGQQDPVAGFEAGVGIYLDDVYLNRPMGAVLEVYDVERVEVLRGPQGTLYGRNTIGGAIKYVTKKLGREPSLSLEGSVGSFSQADLIASAELPLSDTFAVGASVASFNRDGFGKNRFLNEENYDKDIVAIRASAEWSPTYNLFFRLSGDYTDDDSNPRGGHRLIPGLFSGAPVLDDVFDSRSGMTGPNNAEQKGIALLAEYDISPAWMFKSITSYREDDNIQQVDFEALPVADVDVPVIYENEQFSQEFQLAYTSDRIAGIAGFYYLDANAFNAFDVLLAQTGEVIGLPGLNAFTEGDIDTESWSVFADVSFDLADYFGLDTGLELSIGGRYTSDERDSRVLRQTFIGGNSPTFGGPGIPIQTTSDFSGSETFTDFTPRISLAWQPSENHNVYGSFSQGFKGGGFDPRGLTTAAPDFNGDGTVSEDEVFEFMKFDPETVDTWEAGIKSSLFDRRVSTSLAFFYSDYTDIQVPGSVGVDTDGDGLSDTFAGVTTNAGEATVKGVEFEGTALLGRNLMTSGDNLSAATAVGYIDAEYDEFIALVSDPATGSQALQDVSDQRVFQNTPDWTAHFNLRYDRPLAVLSNHGTFSIIGAWSYRGDTNQFEIPSQFLDQSAYSLYDASLIWKRLDGKYEIGLYGRNLGDKEYKVSGHQFVTPDGQTATLGLEGVANAFFGAPRTVTLTAKVNF
ncbi:MAG: TonB-dependent receptor [Xanthomonadaceae bacterium]|nr:TonB-dependent receptor [Xanthomonadaceae bacterium]